MLVEIGGKGGRVCQPALDGELRCPLIIRPNSEDAITGNLFGALQAVHPRRWLPHLLNAALGTNRFRTQVYRDLRVSLWQKQPRMAAHLLPWREGSTEVDVVITWENPATTVFVEAKYRSALSEQTTNNSGGEGYPSDQLIRNARVGLYRSGWYDQPRLFEDDRRDFVLVLLSPAPEQELVERYRDPAVLRQSIPHGERLLSGLPRLPFIGSISFEEVASVISTQRPLMTWSERVLSGQLIDYLGHKLRQIDDEPESPFCGG